MKYLMVETGTVQTTTPGKIIINQLDPLRILQTVSEDDYEKIIQQWQRDVLTKRSDIERVERLAGTGDKGRDVVCTLKNGDWINYQCKHYQKKLSPSDVFIEIGKCCYYSFLNEYTPPKKYFFVSPMGVTSALRDLLKSPNKLRSELIKKWKSQCQKKITSSTDIELTESFLSYINGFDFGVFDYLDPSDFIDEFRKTSHYTTWFGILHKPRPITESAPSEIKETELNYIRKILDAYADYLKVNINDLNKLKEYPELERDFNTQRLYFYSAEYLNAYSRETFAPESQCFEKLKEDMYHYILEDIQSDADNGFSRLKAVLKRAAELTTSANPLHVEINIKDKKGICHHLANEREDVRWTR